MRQRFVHDKQNKAGGNGKRLTVSLAVFAAILVLFFVGIHSFSTRTVDRQKENLENALTRTITFCYTMEGSYPESLEYLEDNYGLTYDEDLFFVDYRLVGANLMPDVTVIEKEAD